MRQLAFLAVVLAATSLTLAQDWEGDLVGAEATGDLHGMVGATWDSQYMWRGFKVFGSKSATHVLGDLNLWETGFGISAAGHYANGSGYVNATRWDYTAYYQNGLFTGESYATNFRVGWVYYDYPDAPSDWADLQEAHAILSWPNLLPIEGLCPSYVVAKTWPSKGSSYLDNASGWYHILMLDYGFTVAGLLPDMPEQLIRLHGEVVYNSGTVPYYGAEMDSGFSHAVIGVATDIEVMPNLTITPAVYYQPTFEGDLKDINDGSDEVWASVGLAYKF
jgi:hypothetical protein